MQDRWKDERASKNEEMEEMHGDDPCIHPSNAELEILCKLRRLFSQPLVFAIRIKVGLLGIHSFLSAASTSP